MDLRERCEEQLNIWRAMTPGTSSVELLEAFALEIRNEALEQAIQEVDCWARSNDELKEAINKLKADTLATKESEK